MSFELEDSDKEENSLLTNDWNELLNDYLVENTNNYELKENNQEIHFPRNDRRVERNYMKSQSYDRHYNERADISNSMQFLKNKLKENTQIHESQHLSLEKYSYQKHLVKCHENNDKVKQLFDNHSSWLKNMRNEVKFLIYHKNTKKFKSSIEHFIVNQ